jgi:hypothetical protein
LTVVETLAPTATEDVRVDALKRLYARRETVDELIRSLELYQTYVRPGNPGRCVKINERKWSWFVDGERQPDEVADVQLAHEAGAVGVHGFGADVQ